MADQVRLHDWASTPLGPLDAWPEVLKTTVAQTLSSRFPQAIVWGEALIMLYNDPFVPILGNKPPALGRPFSEVWQEAWDEVKPISDAAFAGRATYIEDFPLVIERSGYPEQAYFTFCYSPIRDHNGTIVGMIDTVIETTATVLAQRRLAFLDELGRAVASAPDAEDIMATTTRLMAEHLALSNCAYADMEPDAAHFTIRGDWAAPGSPNIVGHYRLADFGKQAVSRLGAGEPLVINDNRQELAADEAAAFQAIGITATICVPLLKDGRLTALMAIHDKLPRYWTAYELSLIVEVAERSWAHIERTRANVKVREAVEALARLNATLEQRVEERTAQLRQTEAALHQSQKLEAIGQLTGGVAHDFNNLLTIIRSSVDFLRRPNLPTERRARYLDAVSDTVDRAAKLTSQLLAFARRQALNPEVFEVGQRLQATTEMLDAVTGGRIEVTLELPDRPCFIHADLNQFETALINMAVNARDAMQGQGRLGLRLTCCASRPPIRGQAGTAGPHAAIAMTDTGHGIEADALERIFEPFYTTKEVGKGTGLGLSQVFGFVKQSGGDIAVSTEPGKGSTFTLFLPEVEGECTESTHRSRTPPALIDGRRLRILLVEDNLEIGRFADQILQDLGYEPRWATSAEQALEWAGEDAMAVDAVFSDIVMPGMGGVALAKELRRRRPGLPVVLTSGYSHVLAQQGHEGFEFLRKPYSADQVAQALSRTIGQEFAPDGEVTL